MNALQMKMARVGLGWGVRDLADAAKVTANTVVRIENGSDAKTSTMTAIQTALEIGRNIGDGVWTYAEFPGENTVKIVFGKAPDEE